MMPALHNGRMILIPVEVRYARAAAGAAQHVLHLVLVDPRLSDIRWVGDVSGVDSPTYSSSFIAQMASRVADLFVAR